MVLQKKKNTTTRILIMLVLVKMASPLPLEDDYGDNFMWILKCCEENFIFGQSECIFNDTIDIRLPVYRADHVTKDVAMKVNFIHYNMECIPSDEESLLFVSQFSASASENFFLQNDGRLWVPKVNASFSNRQFCVDHFNGFGIRAAICFRGLQPVTDKVSGGISLIGLIVSLTFLLITFVVYALLSEQNFHGMCLMCFVFALFWWYFLDAITKFFTDIERSGGFFCHLVGKLSYFFYTSSMFWLNAISYNIWLTFSGIKGFSARKNIPRRKRFLMCNIYAWGAPLFLVMFYVLLGYISPPDAWYNPGLGCWISFDVKHLFIFNGLVGMLAIANVVFFILTAWNIKQARKQTYPLTSTESKKNFKNEDTLSFILYLKLLCGMGINWSIEVINWIISWLGADVPIFMWEVATFCDTIYGVLIFFTFVLRRSVWNSLKQRFYMMMHKKKCRCQAEENACIGITILFDEDLQNNQLSQNIT